MKRIFFYSFILFGGQILFGCQKNKEYSEECINCLLKKNKELIIQLRSFEAMLKEDGFIKKQADYLNFVNHLKYDNSLTKVELVYSPANVAYFLDCFNASSTYSHHKNKLKEVILAPSQYLLQNKKETRSSENYKQFLSGKLNQIKVEDLQHEIYRLSILFACWPIVHDI